MQTSHRRSPYRSVWVIVFVAAGVFAVTGLSNLVGGRDIIPWRTDFAAAQDESRQSGRPMLLYFTASWCQPCQAMRRTTWASDEVEAALRDYVPVKVDIDAQRAVAERYAPEVVPTMAIANADGQVRAITSGGMRPDEFISWLTTATQSVR